MGTVAIGMGTVAGQVTWRDSQGNEGAGPGIAGPLLLRSYLSTAGPLRPHAGDHAPVGDHFQRGGRFGHMAFDRPIGLGNLLGCLDDLILFSE
jgi:hypothetical protein